MGSAGCYRVHWLIPVNGTLGFSHLMPYRAAAHAADFWCWRYPGRRFWVEISEG